MVYFNYPVQKKRDSYSHEVYQVYTCSKDGLVAEVSLRLSVLGKEIGPERVSDIFKFSLE